SLNVVGNWSKTKILNMKFILSLIIVFVIVSIFRALNIYKVIESSSGNTLKAGTWYQCKSFCKGFNAAGEHNGNNYRAMIVLRWRA
ncbi:MAG: hypothetical protein ABI207_02210, partial [Crocinitomicaceae bacterium]